MRCIGLHGCVHFIPPIAIRIEKDEGNYILYWKMTNGVGGYEPGDLVLSKMRKIDESIWNEFIALLNLAGFWDMPTNEKGLLGLDGSQWILEGKISKNYHVVDRWTPSSKSSFYKCCDFLLQQTDLSISGNNKY
ncbi:MAG: hypothetical protein JXR53_10730 [Bacteroidales bacterium]|nr:hypothetical protein [Bacteroidales bacterium]